MNFENVKIAVYVPVEQADEVRKALADAGAGHIGNYDYCSFSTRGTGRFRGLEGSNPTVGEVGELEAVEEERIETICPAEKLDSVLATVRATHPYEEPAIDVYPLLNL